jgi:peroxiredoxin
MKAPKWTKAILLAAGVYNALWGAFAILFPLAGFKMLGIDPPNYPELWQCIGMIVGVYGVGYAIAAFDPYRHWPIVLVGFLGKILGPIGFLNAAMNDRLPWAAGWTILTNDLIWLIPFGLILAGAHEFHLGQKRTMSPEVVKFSLRTRTTSGETIDEISRKAPTLLVFLRHAGCTFCREALADINDQRAAIEAAGTKLVLVHMGEENEEARVFFSKYGLGNVPRISDPNQTLYRAFGLSRGSLGQLFGPVVWWRGFQAALMAGHGVGMLKGDGFQMPGVFLLYHGTVLRSYRHQNASDRPQYAHLVASESFELQS